jgi:hypothetical protein
VWTLPGSLLWVPLAFHAFVGSEILYLAFERSRGHRDGFDGFDIYFHILFLSLPLSVAFAIGWAALAVLKRRVAAADPDPQYRGARVGLSVANVAAPVALYVGLKCALWA